MRVAVNLKFEAEDVARWDAYAEAHKLTRTALIWAAVEEFVQTVEPVESQAPPESSAPESQPPTESQTSSRHKARPGIRRAFVCLKCREKGQGSRIFLHKDEPADTIPQCAEHGPMVREANKPYKGESTEPLPEQGWPEAKA